MVSIECSSSIRRYNIKKGVTTTTMTAKRRNLDVVFVSDDMGG